MKRLLFILILCLLSTATANFQQKPMLGLGLDYGNPFSDAVGFWPLNENSGDKVFDLSGNGNHGAITDATWVPEALDFSLETTARVDCGNPSTQNTTEFTVLVWAKRTGTGVSYVVSQGTYYTTDSAFAIITDSATPRTSFSVHQNYWNSGSTDLLPINEWHMLAISYRQNAWGRAYCDGVLVGNFNDNSDAIDITTKAVNIGNRDGSNSGFDGIIRNCLLYNRALAPSEIASLYCDSYQMIQKPTSVVNWATAGAPPASAPQFISIIMSELGIGITAIIGLSLLFSFGARHGKRAG